MHRVELKVLWMAVNQAGIPLVPNAPCGVERVARAVLEFLKKDIRS